MKWLLVILVTAGVVAALWFFQDELFSIVEGGKDKDGEVEEAPSQPDQDPALPDPDPPDPQPRQPDPEPVDPIAERYPMPEFKPIEELVGNWNDVPDSAFPRTVTLKADVDYPIAGGAGSLTVKSGGKAVALAIAGGRLLIAPSKASPTRGQVAVDDTTFKDELAKSYEAYKERQRKQVIAQRARARELAALEPESASTPPVTSGEVTFSRDIRPSAEQIARYKSLLGPMPGRGADGRVQVMVESIKREDVTEFNLNSIEHWGPVRFEMVLEEPYWTGTVMYKTTSLFGTRDTEAMALMRNGQVIEWVYTGSLEQVP